MPSSNETFLRRWSRLKREVPESAHRGTLAKSASVPDAAELPPLENLSFESDFRGFMRGKVDDGIRRAALKKLFSDPRFNVMDGLDVYIDDYSKEDPISPALLAQLQHARSTLFGPKPETDAPPEEEPATSVAAADTACPAARTGTSPGSRSSNPEDIFLKPT